MIVLWIIYGAIILFTVLDRDILKALGVVLGVIAIGAVICIFYNQTYGAQ